jgi:Fur family iron response transcriptional regulator
VSHESVVDRLRAHGIQPSAQRLAIARYLLATTTHPSADEVWRAAQAELPLVSRATVYNTLNLFVAKGLVRPLLLREGHLVYDPRLDPHHHFLDEDTGEIRDIEWDAVRMPETPELPGLEVHTVELVLRGRARPTS